MSRTIWLIPVMVVALLGIMLLAGCVPQPGTAPQQGDNWTLIIFLVLIFGVFYFLMIRPQRKRQKDQQKMITQLQRGDKVITAGGIYGEIDRVDEDTVNVKIESGGVIKMAKGSVIGKVQTEYDRVK